MTTIDRPIAKPAAAATRLFAFVTFTMVLLLSLAFAMRPAAAQSAGAPRAEVGKVLGNRYGEAPIALGLAQNGGVMELFTSSDGLTWTLVLTMPDGMSRVIATGESWIPVTALKGQPV